MKKNCISVIVPIYNVADYLDKCILSIVNQTFYDIEIILVNDGSTDKSAEICKKYAQIDKRIIYIEKNNGGLSDARNAGIERANGEYLIFVDSDDYVEKDMCSALYKAVAASDAEIACSGYYIDNENSVVSEYSEFNDDIKTLTKDDALGLIFNGHTYAAWGKIYSYRLFERLRFPKGKIDEDYALMYRLFDDVDKVTYIRIPLYHYVKRTGSITKSEFNLTKLDFINNAEEAMDYAKDHLSLKLFNLAKRFYLYRVRMILHMVVVVEDKEKSNNLINELSWILKENLLFILKRRDITAKDKLVFIMDAVNPRIYSLNWKKVS